MLDKKHKETIKYYFRNYVTLKADLPDLKEKILESSPTADGQPRGNGTSDSTGSRGDKLVNLAEVEEWLEVVETTVKYWDKRMTSKSKLIKYTYFSKYKIDEILDMLYISDTTRKEWLNDILISAALIAVSKKLLKI